MAQITSNSPAANMVKETTSTTGTGAKTLLGVRSPGRTVGSALANGDTAEFIIWHATLNEWETGLYTYSTTGPTLTLSGSPYASSNSNAAVSFSAGVKNVALIDPAGRVRPARTFRGNSGLATAAETDVSAAVMREVVSGAVLTQNSQQTATNATTNLGAGAYTVLANSLETTSEYSFEGLFMTGRGATLTALNCVIELLVNGTAVRTLTFAIPTSATQNRGGRVHGRLTMRTTGGSGTCMTSLIAYNDVVGTAGTLIESIDPARSATVPATTTIDTTVNRTIELRFRMSAAVATAYLHVLHCTITKER